MKHCDEGRQKEDHSFKIIFVFLYYYLIFCEPIHINGT